MDIHYHDTDSAETGWCSGCGRTDLRVDTVATRNRRHLAAFLGDCRIPTCPLCHPAYLNDAGDDTDGLDPRIVR